MGYYDNFKPDELEHHGVLGQRWGIRRYQNKDGSRTSLGKNRHNENDSSKSETGKKIAKGVAIGLGTAAVIGAGVYVATNPKTREALKACGKTVISNIKSGKYKEDIKNSAKKAGKGLVKNIKQVPDAMAKGALAAVGMITMDRVLTALNPPEKPTQLQKDMSDIAKGAARAGINTTFNTNYNGNGKSGKNNDSNSGSNIKVDTKSPEYQHLYDGLDEDAREDIKDKAKKQGWTIEQLQDYKREHYGKW